MPFNCVAARLCLAVFSFVQVKEMFDGKKNRDVGMKMYRPPLQQEPNGKKRMGLDDMARTSEGKRYIKAV